MLAFGSFDGHVSLVSDGSSVPHLRKRLFDRRCKVAISHGGDFMVAIGAPDKKWQYSDTAGNGFRCVLPSDNTLCALTLSMCGKLLATGDEGGTVCIWDPLNGHLRFFFTDLATTRVDNVTSLAFSEDVQFLAASNSNHTVCVWMVSTGTLLNKSDFPTCPEHWPYPMSMQFSPKNSSFLAGAFFKSMFAIDLGNAKQLAGVDGGHFVAFSPDGSILATAGGVDFHDVNLYNTTSKTVQTTIVGHNSAVFLATFSVLNLHNFAVTYHETRAELYNGLNRQTNFETSTSSPSTIIYTEIRPQLYRRLNREAHSEPLPGHEHPPSLPRSMARRLQQSPTWLQPAASGECTTVSSCTSSVGVGRSRRSLGEGIGRRR